MAQTFNDNVIINGVADITQLTVKGYSTQTNKLQDWQDSAGVSKASIDKDGKYTLVSGAADGYVLTSDCDGKATWKMAPGSVGSSSSVCNGRLTLSSGEPVTTSDELAATLLYFTPYKGDGVTLYNGTSWATYAFSEISVAVPTSTNTTYDVFIWDDNGTLKLECVAWTLPTNGTITSISNASPRVVTTVDNPHPLLANQLVTIAGNSLAANNATWRVGPTIGAQTFQLLELDNDNSTLPGSVGNGGTWQRADEPIATRANSLVLQNGVLVKSGATTRRYLGTIRTTDVSGQCEDSEAKRFVWNYYNRLTRKLKVIEATNTWTYATAAWRVARNDLKNKVEFVFGYNEDIGMATCHHQILTDTTERANSGIGLDSYTTNSADLHEFAGGANVASSRIRINTTSFYRGYPGVGYHYLAWLEYPTGTVDFYGVGNFQSGLLAEISG